MLLQVDCLNHKCVAISQVVAKSNAYFEYYLEQTMPFVPLSNEYVYLQLVGIFRMLLRQDGQHRLGDAQHNGSSNIQ